MSICVRFEIERDAYGVNKNQLSIVIESSDIDNAFDTTLTHEWAIAANKKKIDTNIKRAHHIHQH